MAVLAPDIVEQKPFVGYGWLKEGDWNNQTHRLCREKLGDINNDDVYMAYLSLFIVVKCPDESLVPRISHKAHMAVNNASLGCGGMKTYHVNASMFMKRADSARGIEY